MSIVSKIKRQLIISEPYSEFGPATVTQDQIDRGMTFQEDMNYVPGWSNLKQQREAEMLEYHAGTRDGKDVSYLPGNLYISRRTDLKGAVDARKLISARNAGYRPVTKDDIGQPWFTELPMGATIQPDGTISNAAGDGQYMWLEGRAAANRARMKENRWLEQSGNIQMGRAEEQTGAPSGAEIQGKDGRSVVDTVKSALGFKRE